MTYKKLAAAILALSLTAPCLYAQTPAAGTTQSTANAVDPASIQALKDMGAHLLTLTRFQVSTGLTGERVLADGQKLQHTARAELDVARPNRLRSHFQSPVHTRNLLRRQDSHPLHPGAKVLLDGRIHR